MRQSRPFEEFEAKSRRKIVDNSLPPVPPPQYKPGWIVILDDQIYEIIFVFTIKNDNGWRYCLEEWNDSLRTNPDWITRNQNAFNNKGEHLIVKLYHHDETIGFLAQIPSFGARREVSNSYLKRLGKTVTTRPLVPNRLW